MSIFDHLYPKLIDITIAPHDARYSVKHYILNLAWYTPIKADAYRLDGGDSEIWGWELDGPTANGLSKYDDKYKWSLTEISPNIFKIKSITRKHLYRGTHVYSDGANPLYGCNEDLIESKGERSKFEFVRVDDPRKLYFIKADNGKYLQLIKERDGREHRINVAEYSGGDKFLWMIIPATNVPD